MPNCCTSARAVVMSTMTCWFWVRSVTLSWWVLLGWPDAAGQVEDQVILQFDRDPGRRAAARRADPIDRDRAQPLAQSRAAGERLLAVKRLEAAGQKGAERQRRRRDRRSGRPSIDGHATTFTILCGTTMTFFGRLPSRAFCTASSARTAASISAGRGVARHGHVRPLLTVNLDR